MEASSILFMRQTLGQQGSVNEETVAFTKRHSNQLSSLLDAKYKGDRKD